MPRVRPHGFRFGDIVRLAGDPADKPDELFVFLSGEAGQGGLADLAGVCSPRDLMTASESNADVSAPIGRVQRVPLAELHRELLRRTEEIKALQQAAARIGLCIKDRGRK